MAFVFADVFIASGFLVVDEAGLVFGFMPVGLAYHAGFSVACAILGWLAIKFAWPTHLEEFAEGHSEQDSNRPS